MNQLHALLRALHAGGVPTDLSAATASALLGSFRPKTEADRIRKAVARDLIDQIRSLDTRLKTSCKAIAEQVENSGSSLPEIVGIGPITAGRLIARTAAPAGSRTRAPTPITSAQPLLRSPAPTTPVTACPAPGTDN